MVEASGWVEDNQWILNLAEREKTIVGFVGNLGLKSDRFEADLKRFAQNRLFRGVRSHAASLDGTGRALGLLADHDLSLDLHVSAESLPNAVRAADRLPNLRIVLNHIAQTPIDGGPPDLVWLERIQQAAERENIYCKVSALVEMTGQTPAPDDPRPVPSGSGRSVGAVRRKTAHFRQQLARLRTERVVRDRVSDCGPVFFGERRTRPPKRLRRKRPRRYKWIDRGS